MSLPNEFLENLAPEGCDLFWNKGADCMFSGEFSDCFDGVTDDEQ
jgi:hypothetical protein